MDFLRSPWINLVAAIAGGIALGYGVGLLFVEITLRPIVWSVIGLVLLWWAISDARKARPGAPESERDGSHTIE